MTVIFIFLFSLSLTNFAFSQSIDYSCDEKGRLTDFSNSSFNNSSPWTWTDGLGKSDINKPQNYLVANKEERLILSYPFNSPLQFHLGATGDQRLPRTREIEAAIRSAVETNTDPYLAMAIGLHESGPNNLSTFTSNLHDSSLIRVLACQNRSPRNGQTEIRNFPDPRYLRKKLELERPGSTKEGKSYFCVGRGAPIGRDVGQYTLLDAPSSDYACCTELPFEPVREVYDTSPWNRSDSECSLRGSYGHIPCAHTANFLFYQSVAKLATDEKFSLGGILAEEKKMDLPFRLQSVLGFSKSTGLLMPRSIANWRLGHDSTKIPVYGLTVLDFYLHSLMSNPWIQQKVHVIEKELMNYPKSFLCFGKTPLKTYSINSDRSTKLISSAKRFEVQIEKWKKGTPLSDKEKDMLGVEMATIDSQLSRTSLGNFEARLQRYFREDYPSRSTIEAVSKKKNPSFTWQEFTEREILKLREEVLSKLP